MPLRRGRKVALIGLDSITPAMIDRMLAEGAMPALARLAGRGWSSQVVPTMPPSTPAGWTTVATGAWPSTHGIEGFAVHREGDPLDRKVHALSADVVRAERIWEVAGRHGMETVLLKYPVSWPPSASPLLTQVDGAGGWGGLKCVHDLVHSGCWDSRAPAPAPAGPAGVPQEWMTRDADNLDEESVRLVRLEAPAAWRGLPDGFQPASAAVLDLAGREGGEARAHALIGRTAAGARVLLAACPDAGGSRPLAAGDWSDWLALDLGRGAGHVRFRVMELAADPPVLRLYQTQVHRRDGFTVPPELAGELEAAAGPFEEWTESYDLLQGWIDHPTQLEVYRDHLAWMARASRHLLRERPWRLFMTQVHVLDMAYHIYWGAVDPRHPEHRPELADRYWDLLREAHRLTDGLLAEVLEEVDEETLVVVLGDHGHDLYHTALLTNQLLVREGLLALARDPRTGRPRIDWACSAAYASSYRVYLNVRGREPDGVVAPADVARTRDRVIAALTGIRDPRTGEAPVRLAVTREDAASLGLHGGGMGDVVFAMAPGYQARGSIGPPDRCWIGSRLVPERVPVLEPTRLFREFTGEHDTALPFNASIRTLLYLAGPGVRRGCAAVPVRLVDVAPTICAWLGLPQPAQCEGAPLLQPFEPGALRPPPW